MYRLLLDESKCYYEEIKKVSITKRCTDCFRLLRVQKLPNFCFNHQTVYRLLLASFTRYTKMARFQSPNGVQIALPMDTLRYIGILFQSPNGVQIASTSECAASPSGCFNHQTVYRLLFLQLNTRRLAVCFNHQTVYRLLSRTLTN